MSRLWWGQAVQGDAYTQPWLNESLPMYSELLFYQTAYPKLESWYWEARINYWQPTGNLDRGAAQFVDTEDYSRNLLRRGALFLRDVRTTISDEAFADFLRDLYLNSNGRTITTTDFLIALRRHTNSDLNPLLARYFGKQTMPTVIPPIGAATATPFTHVVRAGETLGGIAKFYGVNVEAIVKANKLSNADAIFVGQRLLIPK
jgi:aminopeptidase N